MDQQNKTLARNIQECVAEKVIQYLHPQIRRTDEDVMNIVKWFEPNIRCLPETPLQIDVVEIYYEETLKDITGKYMFISKRRIKWFLLSKIHLYDCTLTYFALYDRETKKKLLQELEELSNRIHVPDNFKCNHNHCASLSAEEKQKECTNFIRKEELEFYKRGQRREIDLCWRETPEHSHRNYFFSSSREMDDDKGFELTMYCCNGDTQQTRHIISRNIIDYNSYYFVGDIIEKFTLEIILYNELLLHSTSETFVTYFDSSPMSCLKEIVEEYLERQQQNVEQVIGKEATQRLMEVRKKLRNMSKINLTIFEVYRMFYIF